MVYLTALLDGNNPLTELVDEKFVWTYDKKTWSPENYEHKYNGKIPLYFALKESLNSPTAQMAQKLGIEKVVAVARQIGFTAPMESTPATSLGASVHSPIEVLDAYRTLANLGQFTHSGFIEKVKNKENLELFSFKSAFEPHVDAIQVAVLVGMMKETFKSGTAKSSRALGWDLPSAGKTGTTSDNKDAWFAAFTPHQTTVVWLGYDQGISSQLTGGSGAVPVWVDLMKGLSSHWSEGDFTLPEGVEKREVHLHGTDKKTELIFKKSSIFF